MKRTALFLGLLALPAATFALDFSNVTNRYNDAPFSKAESAGISVLTNLGAVSGNPDGTFAPNRTLNRAEFLKMVFGSVPNIAVTDSDVGNCFPDVHVGDWFSRYVCLAQKRGTVDGYPDGFFRPGNPVNYAEALKIMAEIYKETLPEPGMTEKWAWYTAYLRAATADNVALSGVDPAALLTRGQAVRLAAAYRAWKDGVLGQYRALERGELVVSSSSSSSSSSVSSESSSQTSSTTSSSVGSSLSSGASTSSSSSSSMLTSTVFPSVSHFFLLGMAGPSAIDGTFVSPDEDAYLRFADVTLRREVKSIISMTLIDGMGKSIGTLLLGTDNNGDHRKWRLVLTDNTFTFKKGTPVQLGVVYTLRNRSDGGVPNELIDGIESFSVTVAGTVSNASRQLVPTDAHYPQSQTAEARITGVTNAGSGTSIMRATNNRLLGRFLISGLTVTGGVLNIDSLDFNLATSDASVTNIRIGGPASIQQAGCAVDSTISTHITCPVLPDGFKTVGTTPLDLSIYGDVTLRSGSAGGWLQILFPGRGMIGQTGSVRWSDTVGHYNWIESTAALQNGTLWTVLP